MVAEAYIPTNTATQLLLMLNVG